jgi:hypothetical protein
MDPQWRELLVSKDYLFPAADWGAGAWLANLGTAALAIGTLWYRVTSGLATPRESGLLAGAVALTVGFLATLPAVTAGWAFFVQLQISRVFWLLDLLATVSLLWLLVDAHQVPGRSARARWARACALLLVAASAARGGWVTWVEHRDRAALAMSLPEGDWTRVIEWAHAQPVTTHLLVDPGHAWRYGAPLRYSGRDVFLEEVKDTAMAIYARTSAARVIERQAALGDFGALDAEQARSLGARYGLDYLVIDRDLPLPLHQRIGDFRIYAIR